MKLLAIDTASNVCAACLFDGASGRILAEISEDIGTGHSERLFGMIDAVLAEAGIGYPDLTHVAASVGPGSFMGIRTGVAAARGLALALDIPSTGVTVLDALAFEAGNAHPERPVIAVIDARRDELYAASYGSDGAVTHPACVASAKMVAAWAGPQTVLTGSGAALLRERLATSTVHAEGRTAAIASFARLAALRGDWTSRPKPLYLRAPDARPQAGFALARQS